MSIRLRYLTAEAARPFVEDFRVRTFLGSGRPREYAATWGWDDWDASALHLVGLDKTGTVIGALRIHCDTPWPLEHKLGRSVASPTGMEIGRLTVAVGWHDARRTLFDLLFDLCRRGPELGKTHAYGLVVDRFWRALTSRSVPLHVACLDVAAPYGSPTHLTRFELAELAEFYRTQSPGVSQAAGCARSKGSESYA